MKYIITVCRTERREVEFEINASSESHAKEMAIEEAFDFDFSNAKIINTEMEVSDVSQGGCY
jgi:hypothetical protein